MEISKNAIKKIRRAGAALLAVGIGPIVWILFNSQPMSNYLRLVVMLPFFIGVPMFSINDYLGGWDSLAPRSKGRAIASLFAPFIISVAALLWYLNAPAAKA